MINKPLPSKGLNIRILILIPIQERGFINQGSGLGCVGFRVQSLGFRVLGFRVQGLGLGV